MDFSKDLAAKQNDSLSYQMSSQLLHYPIIRNIACSEEALPSIHELGILIAEVQKSLISVPIKSSPRLHHTESDLTIEEPQSEGHQSTRRCRISMFQKEELNKVFAKSFFPSTEVRAKLALELNMKPRAVQIWFQNKRQAWRSKHKPGPILMNSVFGQTSVSYMNPYLAPRPYTSSFYMPLNEGNLFFHAHQHPK